MYPNARNSLICCVWLTWIYSKGVTFFVIKMRGKRERKLARRETRGAKAHQESDVIMEEAQAPGIETILAYGDATIKRQRATERRMDGAKTRQWMDE